MRLLVLRNAALRSLAPREQVLDETFALQESKRLELEYLAKEKEEEERRLQREHEATKVRAKNKKKYIKVRTRSSENIFRERMSKGWSGFHALLSPNCSYSMYVDTLIMLKMDTMRC